MDLRPEFTPPHHHTSTHTHTHTQRQKYSLCCMHKPGAWSQTHTHLLRYSIFLAFLYTDTHALCRCRSPACYIIQEGVYQRPISSSMKTLKGCFVFFLPETPWTHRLPSSRGYLFTTAWICKFLSRLPAVTEGKCFTRNLSVPGVPVHR